MHDLLSALGTVIGALLLAWTQRRGNKRIEKKVAPVSNGFAAGVNGKLDALIAQQARTDKRVVDLIDQQQAIAHTVDEHTHLLNEHIKATSGRVRGKAA